MLASSLPDNPTCRLEALSITGLLDAIGHLIFQATSPLGRGELKSKGGAKKTVHYNGSEETVEMILRTVISVNQLSIYGAVADLCNELDPGFAECESCESLRYTTSQSFNIIGTGKLFARLFQ